MEVKTWKHFTAFLCCAGFLLALSEPPERIELDPVPEMEVGKQYNLTCWVLDVAPIRNLTVTLLKGEEQLLVKTFENHTHPDADDVVVTHLITAQEDDHSKKITCQTSLDLRPTGPLLKNTSQGISLWIFGAQEKDPITPLRKAVVKFGNFFVLNCTTNGSSSSSNSSCDIQERSSHNYDYKDDGSTWKTFTFIVSYWSLSASCVVTCNNEPRSWETIVTVYQPPERIELDPVPEMEVGKQYNLTCRVLDVAPIRNLTVTLLKGEEQLLVKTFENHTHPDADDVVVTHLITAQEDDHSKKITCQTSLDLRPTGPLLKNTSQESYLAIIVAAVAVATLPVCVLIAFLIFIIKRWIN